MKLRAMIMAAGIGSRLDPLTACSPKPMVKVLGVPMIEHVLNLLNKYNATDVIVNTYYFSSQITEYFSSNQHKNIKLNFLKEDQLSGTAGGVKKCADFLNVDGTFLVMSGDSLTDINLEKLIEKHKSSGALASMALKAVPANKVHNYGVCVTNYDSQVIGFQEKPSEKDAKSNFVNTGIYVFEPEIFNYIKDNTFSDFANDVFPLLIKDEKLLYGFEINEYWNDVGTFNEYLSSCYDALNDKVRIEIPGEKFEYGWKAANVTIPERVKIEDKVFIDSNTIIADNVLIKGNVSIGQNCNILEGSILNGCVLSDNVKICKNAELNKCIIGNFVSISNNSVLNEGTVIANYCPA